MRAAVLPLLVLALLGAASAALAPTVMPTATAAGLTLVPAPHKLVQSLLASSHGPYHRAFGSGHISRERDRLCYTED